MIDRRDVGVAHVRAHRFARRRTDEALTLGTTDLAAGPGWSDRRLTLFSALLAVTILAGAAVMSVVHPAPQWRTAAVLIESGSGAVFLNRDGVLHPALNLTSALLAAAGPAGSAPVTVAADDIGAAPRGPTVGIAGAPDRLPTAERLAAPRWSLCDRIDTGGAIVTTEVIGDDVPGAALGAADAVLVAAAAAPAGSAVVATTTRLIWGAGSLAVDPSDRALERVLGLAESMPRPVSAAVAAALPGGDPLVITPPPGAGGVSTGSTVRDEAGATVPVGSVLQVTGADGGRTLYLLHDDGIEPLDPLVADLLRYRTGAPLVAVSPRQIADLPSAAMRTVAPGRMPPAPPRLLDAATVPVVCASWSGETGAWRVVVGSADTVAPAAVTSAAGSGSRVDRVQIAPGSGALVRRGPATDENPDAGTVFVSDLGVAHPITRDAAVQLGLLSPDGSIPVVPAALIDALPPGPPLDRDAAARDWDFDPAQDRGPTATTATATG